MALETIISIASVVISTFVALVTYWLYRQINSKIVCTIKDIDSPSYINTGTKNLQVIEKIVLVKNIGRGLGSVSIDIWTKQNMVKPFEIHTNQKYTVSANKRYQGFYGKYVNVQIDAMKPKTLLEVRISCLFTHVKQSDYIFFQKIEVVYDKGKVKVLDISEKNPFPKAKEEIVYSLKPPNIAEIDTTHL